MPHIPTIRRINFSRATIVMLALFAMLALMRPGIVHASGKTKIAVLVSMAIRPYMDAVEGIEEVVSGHSDTAMELIILDDFGADAINALAARLVADRFRVLIAIGPEAARFAWNDVKGDETMLRLLHHGVEP